MHKVPVSLDTWVGSNFLQTDCITPFLRTGIVQKSVTAKNHNANNKGLRIISSFKLCVHGSQTTKLANFLKRKKLAVPAIFNCGFCDQFAELVYQKTGLLELVYTSTVPIVRQFGNHRSTLTKKTNIVSFLKCIGCVSPKA